MANASREALLLCVLSLAAGPCCGFGAVPPLTGRNLTIVTYAEDGVSRIATFKVGRLFTDHRRLGFFRVKLLPLLVAQDVRLELGAAAANRDWAAAFEADLKPLLRRYGGGGSSEWRDFSIWLPGESAARLQARRVCQPAGAEAESLTLEGVTLQTANGPIKRPTARLQLKQGPGQVIWEAQGTTFQWQLFTGQLISEPSRIKQRD